MSGSPIARREAMYVQRETEPLVQHYVDEMRETMRAAFWRDFTAAGENHRRGDFGDV